ncbi:UNVERIFIED_CONTAM: hypothetical protein RMT77_014801 [Armadillidium vulgare]
MTARTGIDTLTKGKKWYLTDHKQYLNALLCSPSLYDCHFGKCSNCKNQISELEAYLFDIFNNNVIDDVLYKQQLMTDRTTLETVSKATDEFIDTFVTAQGA